MIKDLVVLASGLGAACASFGVPARELLQPAAIAAFCYVVRWISLFALALVAIRKGTVQAADVVAAITGNDARDRTNSWGTER